MSIERNVEIPESHFRVNDMDRNDLISRAEAIEAVAVAICNDTDEIEALKKIRSSQSVHIETYRDLYEKYMELKHASAGNQDEKEYLDITFPGHDCGEWIELTDMMNMKESPDPEPKLTQEAKKALMQLTLCATEECNACKYNGNCCFGFQYNISIQSMNKVLEALNEHDSVDIVRCFGCKYLGIKDFVYGYCTKKMTGEVKPSDFCSYAERRTDNEHGK